MFRVPLIPVAVMLLSALLIVGCSEDDPVVVTTGSTLSIDAEPDSLDAGWVLYGPNDYILEDNGDKVLSGLTPGEYKLVWSDIEFWDTPDSSLQLLTTYEDIEFEGVYRIQKGTIIVDITPFSIPVKWNIQGPNGYLFEGFGSRTLYKMERGSYSIRWNDHTGWTKPAQDTESLDLEIGATIVFAASYDRADEFEYPVILENTQFLMGSPITEFDREIQEKQHNVLFNNDLLVKEFEVTQAEYDDVMGANPSLNAGCDDCPVENISWYDAIDYCNERSILDGLTPAYWDSVYIVSISAGDTVRDTLIAWDRDADGWRLPTESEWEYACRIGTLSPFNTGYCLNPGIDANFNGTMPYNDCEVGEASTGTMAVGSFMPTRVGIFDMHGNVSEWCWDYSDRAPFTTADLEDPFGLDPAKKLYRVVRGGSWGSAAARCRSSQRDFHSPEWTSGYLGFRVVKTVFVTE